ncbi:MAG: O-antigen ligase family protein [Coraliomargaritaceae bacterium]
MNPEKTGNRLTLRDKLLRDTFTISERFLTWLLIISSVAVLYPGQPRSYWLLGFFLIIGALTPVLLKTHEVTHPFFIDRLWQRFFLLSAPLCILILQFLGGLLQNPLDVIVVDNHSFHQLVPINLYLPTTTEAQSTWFTLFAFGSIYIFCSAVFFIPKSLAYFERVLPILCLIASLVGVFGFMQNISGSLAPFYARDHSSTDYFSIFAYDGHWAAYALLWMTACFCFAIRHLQFENHLPITKTMAPWYLSGALLLGYSGLFIQSRFPSSILLLYFSFLTILYTIIYFKRNKISYRRISFTLVALVLIVIASGVALQRLLHPQAFDLTASSLRQSALRMFLDNPLFGWGVDSFSHLGVFYQGDLLLGNPHERAFSDIFQMFAEFGLIGMIPISTLIIWLLIRYLSDRCHYLLSNLLLAACFGVCLIAFVDSPFMSPAVFLSFLILFFSALRWTDLSRKSVDEVDAHTVVVTDSTLRRVPVYSGPKNEKFK